MNVFFHALGITDVWQLVAATMIFLLLPGPGSLCVLTCAGQRGLRGGFASLLGLMLGDAVLMFAAAIGVAALLQANPLLFKGMQYLGAAYLAWLGIKLLFAKAEQGNVAVPFSNAADFRRGFLVTLINPKAIVFYMAFFPLFIDPARHQGMATFATLAALVAVLSVAYCSLLIVIGHGLARRLHQHPRIGAWLRRVAGVGLIGFGVRLSVN